MFAQFVRLFHPSVACSNPSSSLLYIASGITIQVHSGKPLGECNSPLVELQGYSKTCSLGNEMDLPTCTLVVEHGSEKWLASKGATFGNHNLFAVSISIFTSKCIQSGGPWANIRGVIWATMEALFTFPIHVHEGSVDRSHRTWCIWLSYDLARYLMI